MNDYDSVVDDDDDDYFGDDGDNKPSIISYHTSSLHMTQDILKK